MSFSKKALKSSIPCLNIVILSIPIPKANPVTSSESYPTILQNAEFTIFKISSRFAIATPAGRFSSNSRYLCALAL